MEACISEYCINYHADAFGLFCVYLSSLLSCANFPSILQFRFFFSLCCHGLIP